MRRGRPTFAEELEARLIDAFDGSPVGPALAGRLKLAARTACVNHGLHDARILVRAEGNGMVVEVIPPPSRPTVQRVVLGLGAR